MNVIWVAEDIKKDQSFKQTKAEVLCTLSCLLFIKQYHPNFKTIFFVDDYTKKYYEQFGFLELFDEVNDTILNEQIEDIDKNLFWAAGKILAQRNTPGPTLTLDLDFRIFNDISKFGVFDGDICALWLEVSESQYYLTPSEALSYSNLNWKYDWSDLALNVSFLYLKNENFKNLYCDLAIDYMKSCFGKIPEINDRTERNKFILFAEQYMLHQLAKEHRQQIKLLIDNFYPIPKSVDYIKSSGIDINNCGFHFYHYGGRKSKMINKEPHFYNEMDKCYSSVNDKIRNKSHINIFNKIYNISEYDMCFC
jgi:hypothetical protein